MKTVREILLLTTEFFQKKGISDPRLEAEEIISYGLGWSRIDLYLKFDYPCTEAELGKLRGLLSRRANREPLQYIRGDVEFFNCPLKVSPSVLIPRPETEQMVEKIANHLDKLKQQEGNLNGFKLWDICTGSGCIAISLKKKFPEMEVYASDISAAALEIARENSARNQAEVNFLEGNLFEPFSKLEKADLIVSNPPYIAEEEFLSLQAEVRDYEPKNALVAEEKGLSFYQIFAERSSSYLNFKGGLWLEIGSSQKEEIRKIFSNTKNWKKIDCMQDWYGNDRFFFLEKEAISD